MTVQPTLILAGLAAGALAAGIAMSPSASAAVGSPSCGDGALTSQVCQTPDDYEGRFGPTTQAPSPFEFPYGFLTGI